MSCQVMYCHIIDVSRLVGSAVERWVRLQGLHTWQRAYMGYLWQDVDKRALAHMPGWALGEGAGAAVVWIIAVAISFSVLPN